MSWIIMAAVGAVCMLIGFALGLMYAHGSEDRRDRKERRAHKRIVQDIKAGRAEIGKPWQR